jgi:hypothetical protein
MKRSALLAALLLTGSLSLLPSLTRNRAAAADSPPIPATRYYPLSIGTKWDFNFKRITSFSLIPTEGDPNNFSLNTEGTQTVEVTREDGERSGDQGKVFVQRTTELGKATGGSVADSNPDNDQKAPRLVGESYFRVNPRGIWLISDGEADDKGENVEKVTDRRLPLLWVPTDMKPDKSWTITCQIDPMITARITSRVGKAQTLKINGATYENCIPVVSIAEKMNGRLDLGGALAPIREGRIVDVTYYAPQIGIVKGHQLANFTLEPPSARFTGASAHFEESTEIQPGYRIAP